MPVFRNAGPVLKGRFARGAAARARRRRAGPPLRAMYGGALADAGGPAHHVERGTGVVGGDRAVRGGEPQAGAAAPRRVAALGDDLGAWT
ncbi:hypothetical protein, partial [Actinomadura sediminis]